MRRRHYSTSFVGRRRPWVRPRTRATSLAFLADVLRAEVRATNPPNRDRARSTTLSHLAALARARGRAYAFIYAITAAGDETQPHLPALVAQPSLVIAMRPLDAFLRLPAELCTTATTRRVAASPGLLVPAFQITGPTTPLAPATEDDTVGRVNTLLSGDRDPWGAASWWAAPNGWLSLDPPIRPGARAGNVGIG